MILSKNAKKLLFFWIIFHSIGYASYLWDIHPSFKYEKETAVYTNYLLTPEMNAETEKENFYPFHKFTTNHYTSHVHGKFVGVYGYYGNYEYFVYVVLPLLSILIVWVYREFIE